MNLDNRQMKGVKFFVVYLEESLEILPKFSLVRTLP